MRILVTGVTGQVGSALAKRLASMGTVIAADRRTLDLSAPNDISAKLEALAPELIVNPAAYTAVDRAEDEPDLAFCVNAEAPAAMARWAGDHAVPLLHFSTDYVFDGRGDRPWLETDIANPLSVYGASKLAGETAIRDVGGSHLIVRTSWVYAAQGNNFLRTISRLAREQRELRIVADQFGAPTSAAIIADGIATMLAGRADIARAFSAADGTVHLAASGVTTWHEFGTAIVEGIRARGSPVSADRIVPIGAHEYRTKATRPPNSRLDLSRLKQVFDFTPLCWKAGLERELDHLAKLAD